MKIHSIDGTAYPSLKDACRALNLDEVQVIDAAGRWGEQQALQRAERGQDLWPRRGDNIYLTGQKDYHR